MQMKQVINKVVVSAESHGIDETKAKLEALSGSQAKVAQTANGMALATDTADKRRISSAHTYQRMIERVDRMAAIERQLARDMALAEQQLREGAVSADQYAAAVSRIDAHYTRQIVSEEARRAKIAATTVELDGQTMATNRLAAANDNLGKQVRQNLMYQYSDVATSLVGGMPVHMIAMQQGGQIIGGPGGLNAALKETGNLATMAIKRFGLIGAAIGLGAAAIGDMQRQINENSAAQVSFGDTALAVWQSVADGVGQFIAPVTDKIVEWFGQAWRWVMDATKEAANFIIRSIVAAVEYVSTNVSSLPAAFIMAGEAAANGFVQAINWMVEQSVVGINSLIDGMNGLGAAMGGAFEIARIEAPKFEPIDMGGAKAVEEYAAAWQKFGNTMSALGERDMMGEWFGDIQQRAIANAAAGLEDVGAAAGTGAATLNHRTDEDADALFDRMLSPRLAA